MMTDTFVRVSDVLSYVSRRIKHLEEVSKQAGARSEDQWAEELHVRALEMRHFHQSFKEDWNLG